MKHATTHVFSYKQEMWQHLADYKLSALGVIGNGIWRTGKPVSPSNIIRRHLHPALKELGYVNPFNGTHKAGNHAFRRFLNTYLRNKTQCPEGLRNYWIGTQGKFYG